MFFVYLVDQSVQATRQSQSRYQVLRAPAVKAMPHVPHCKPKVGGNECLTCGPCPIGALPSVARTRPECEQAPPVHPMMATRRTRSP